MCVYKKNQGPRVYIYIYAYSYAILSNPSQTKSTFHLPDPPNGLIKTTPRTRCVKLPHHCPAAKLQTALVGSSHDHWKLRLLILICRWERWLSSSSSWLLSWLLLVPHPQTVILSESEATWDFATHSLSIHVLQMTPSWIKFNITSWSPKYLFDCKNHHDPCDALRDPFQNWLLDKHHYHPVANQRKNHPKLKMVHVFITTKRDTKICVYTYYYIVFPKIVVPKNEWFIRENPIKMDDLGVPLYKISQNFALPSSPKSPYLPAISTLWVSLTITKPTMGSGKLRCNGKAAPQRELDSRVIRKGPGTP